MTDIKAVSLETAVTIQQGRYHRTTK